MSVEELRKLCAQNNIKELVILKKEENDVKRAKELKQHSEMKDVNITILRGRISITEPELQQILLNSYHIRPTGGHAGISRMYNTIKKRYFWKGLFKDVEAFVKRCDECQRHKHSVPQIQPLSITTTATAAFEKISLDLMGPLIEDAHEKKYVLTIQCDLSKYVEAYPIENKEAETVARAYLCVSGYPRVSSYLGYHVFAKSLS